MRSGDRNILISHGPSQTKIAGINLASRATNCFLRKAASTSFNQDRHIYYETRGKNMGHVLYVKTCPKEPTPFNNCLLSGALAVHNRSIRSLFEIVHRVQIGDEARTGWIPS
jgi:hypothetical protein